MDKRITIADLFEAKRNGRKIAAISCYDYTTAKLVSQTPVEMILVGDSAAQLVLGYDSTLPVTMDFMVAITAAVRRGAPNVCLVADMPFLSYHLGRAETIKNAARFVTEAGAQIVKVEATINQLDVIKAISDAGMAVMAHIGMLPQSISKTGRLKAEGTTAEMAVQLINLARQMTDAGAMCLLLEGVAAEVAKIITQQSEVPVISCGSGPYCDGQILVAPDVLGLTSGRRPKFAKTYTDLGQQIIDAMTRYANEVIQGIYPSDEYCYHIKKDELERLEKLLNDKLNS